MICLGLLGFFLIIGMPIFMGLLLSGLASLHYLEGYNALSNIAGKLAFNQLLGFPLLAIPMFILMGNLLTTHRMGEDLFSGLHRWFGSLPGGFAIGSTVVCAIFGFMSGSNTAAAATVGSVAIPAMEEKKYYRPLSLGTLAVAGTLAALIPPSTIMIIYGSAATNVSIGRVFVGGILPGILLTFLMSLYIYLYARVFPKRAPRGDKASWTEKILGLKELAPAIFLFVTIIGGMYAGIFTAIEASAVSVFATLILLVAYRRLSVANVLDAMKRTVKVSGMIYMIIVGATILSHVFFITGFRDLVSDFLLSFNLPGWGTMILVLLILTVLGTFLDVIALIMIAVPIFLPVAVQSGYDGVWFGVIMVIASEMALCTPPVGVNLFVIQGISPPGTSLMTVARGAAPFIGVIWLLLLLLIFFPPIVTWLPSRMAF
ncbi:TRAP transporter large permease [Castellaniella sp. GW247-6E4]|uniref:TRAP transporter large permease n=1 Tax=Castellaniella sp. GW247-6E4 TaxID=3140380 RepID=UPI0033163530